MIPPCSLRNRALFRIWLGAAVFRGSRNSRSVTTFSRSWREPIAGRRPGRPLWARGKGWPAAPGRLPLPTWQTGNTGPAFGRSRAAGGPGPVRYRPRRRCRMSPAAPQRAGRSVRSGLGGGARVPRTWAVAPQGGRHLARSLTQPSPWVNRDAHRISTAVHTAQQFSVLAPHPLPGGTLLGER